VNLVLFFLGESRVQEQPSEAKAAEVFLPVKLDKPAWPFPEGQKKQVTISYPKFLHIRYGVEDGNPNSNIKIADQGGISIAYEVVEGKYLRVAYARCSVLDNFCYRVGRKIAAGRLANKRLGAITKLETEGKLEVLDLAPEGDPTLHSESIQQTIIQHLTSSSEADIISVKHGKRRFWLYV
jgi:hypothetical protein